MLSCELFLSEEDEDTSGKAHMDSKPRQAAALATPTATMGIPLLRRNEEDHPLHTHVIVTL